MDWFLSNNPSGVNIFNLLPSLIIDEDLSHKIVKFECGANELCDWQHELSVISGQSQESEDLGNLGVSIACSISKNEKN